MPTTRSRPPARDRRLTETLSRRGRRFTPQRQQVYAVLLEKTDHPTAEQVFLRVKHALPDISFATVYNSLSALVQCGLVNQVHSPRTATRYCPNMAKHYHFYCERCGGVFDIHDPGHGPVAPVPVPRGYRITHCEMTLHGFCPACGGRNGHRPLPHP